MEKGGQRVKWGEGETIKGAGSQERSEKAGKVSINKRMRRKKRCELVHEEGR